jgi:transglutaminase/protease-like cytokinesis protein 3
MAASKLKSSPKTTARKSGHPATRPTKARGSSRVASKSSDPALKQKPTAISLAASKPIEAGSSKQASVLAMLGKPGGATISAIMKITGWQPHTVRGFFAGTVRKRLGLNLVSDKSSGDRSYRIKGGTRSRKA